jgi:hypothetical protein
MNAFLEKLKAKKDLVNIIVGGILAVSVVISLVLVA